MADSQKVHTLTAEQLTEVCVQFAASMGWVDSPGGIEWRHDLEAHGSAEAFHISLMNAQRRALEKTAEGITTSLDALKKLEDADAH